MTVRRVHHDEIDISLDQRIHPLVLVHTDRGAAYELYWVVR